MLSINNKKTNKVLPKSLVKIDVMKTEMTHLPEFVSSHHITAYKKCKLNCPCSKSVKQLSPSNPSFFHNTSQP